MIIDAILGRKDSLKYDSKNFYNVCMSYGKVGENIARAMDGGIEADVKDALIQYVQDNDYNPLISDYINRVNWIRGTEPTVEKAAAEEFNAGCKAREESAEKMQAPEGKENVFAFECGVLLSPEHDEFEFYANNNPELPYGFYDENQGMFLKGELLDELRYLKEYVKNGVDNTYAIVSYQGLVDIGSKEHSDLEKGEFDTGSISYTYFKNADEIVWSGCKIDGKLVECFLEKEIKLLNEKIKNIAQEVRQDLIAKYGEALSGKCIEASDCVVSKLASELGLTATSVEGWCQFDDESYGSDRPWDPHTWVEVPDLGLYIDVTADQFNFGMYAENEYAEVIVQKGLPSGMRYDEPSWEEYEKSSLDEVIQEARKSKASAPVKPSRSDINREI